MNGLAKPLQGDRIGTGGRPNFGSGLRVWPPRPGFAVCDRCWGIGCITDVATLLLVPPVCETCGGIGEIPFRRPFRR